MVKTTLSFFIVNFPFLDSSLSVDTAGGSGRVGRGNKHAVPRAVLTCLSQRREQIAAA